ncbi:MAG: amino acid deaminase/aldolase [Candidatus Hydrogenedentales bacterium]
MAIAPELPAENTAAAEIDGHSYRYYRAVLQNRALPCAFLDVDLLDANIAAIRRRAQGTPLRIASKSVRCEWVLRRVLANGPPFRGIMCFHPAEAAFLAMQGFDDLLLGYPFYRDATLRPICEPLRQGKTITCMVDSAEQITQLDRFARAEDVTISVCIDVDMSSDFPGIHFGVRRSPITAPRQLAPLVEALRNAVRVELRGLMGYEAQIAGLPDHHPANGKRNLIIPTLKRRSVKEVRERRAAAVKYLRDAGFELPLVNGGGTGSIETTREETAVTEVTVGSGFFAPTLFDHYAGFKHKPAAGYALEIVRIPKPGIYTCAGGGYIASGGVGKDKQPLPYLPGGAELLDQEGAGEVQTPVGYVGVETLRLGDPVFMRHAKAGELCERFNTLLLIQDGRVVDEVPTYRGAGQCFL